MYILEPIVHETIWGGDRLHKYTQNYVEKIGHLYLASGLKEMSNNILNGPYRGQTLYEIFEAQKQSWNISEYREFPLKIALVDASSDLSIQVHPDELAAKELENEQIGKTESWIFMEPPKSGWIYNGCLCRTKAEVEAAVLQENMLEITGHLPN